MKSGALLQKLLARGDQVSIDNGEFELVPVSGNPVPDAWLQQHQHQLICDIASFTGIVILVYEGYSTGRYGLHRAGGVTLQFNCLTTATSAYSIFNANLTRARNTKHGAAGTPLPDGLFRVRKKHNFFKFWERTGFAMPRRLSSFHDHMGVLRGILFTGEFVKDERLRTDSICPVQLTCQQLKEMAIKDTDNSQTISRQLPDNSPTINPDKETPETEIARGFQPLSTTGNSYYGNKGQGSTVIRGSITPITIIHKNLKEQGNDEWLAEYEASE